ncbi:MAG TPA: PHB depolymerase family esterase [Acidimicrobiales bacterium]
MAAALLLAACSGSSRPPHAALPPAPSRSPSTGVAPTSTTVPTGPTPCSPTRPQPAGLSTVTMSYQGQDRTYALYVPASYSGTTSVPVVFEFHGYSSNAFQQVVYGDFRPLADRDGFVIVAPNGQGRDQHYNLTREPGLQDDVAFVGAVADRVESQLCVDRRRIYATGMSDGGAMTSALACGAAGRFAAFGPVAAELYLPTCAAGRDVSIAAFHGTADPIVPFKGGGVSCCGSPTLGSAPDAMAGWAGHDGCAQQFTDTRLSPQVIERQWSGCHPGTEVRFYMIQGGGHTWPGSKIALGPLGLTTNEISATDTLWAFFQAHPLT